MKYEYKIQPVSFDPTEKPPFQLDERLLEQFGLEGWELVSVVASPKPMLAFGDALIYFLRRAIR